MVVSFAELGDMVIMVAALGYIFMDILKRPAHAYDPMRPQRGFDMAAFKFSCLVVAPGILLHELGHKFVAIAYGLTATFHASIVGLALGIFLKLINSGIIVFVPGFVSISPATPMQTAVTAFAGPFMNLLLALGAWFVLANYKNLKSKTKFILILTKRINFFLFIFNMIPLGIFDGAKVFRGLRIALFG